MKVYIPRSLRDDGMIEDTMGDHHPLTRYMKLEDAQQENAQLKAELAKLHEWQNIILGTGTDQEAVIRLAAAGYTQTAVQCWRIRVEKLEADLENARSAMHEHMEIHAKVVNELTQAQQREDRLREALEDAIGAVSELIRDWPKDLAAPEIDKIAKWTHALEGES